MMRRHYDHIHSIFDGKMKGVPIVSIVGNLNEDYEGSEFHCRGKEIKLKTGDILMFPADILHYVKPNPKEEDRISISFNTDIELPMDQT